MLSTPPAFILSQDQTLMFKSFFLQNLAWLISSVGLSSFTVLRSSVLHRCVRQIFRFAWIILFEFFKVFYCSVINVLFVVSNNFDILAHLLSFVNNFFIFFFAIVFWQLCKSSTICFHCQELFYFVFADFQSQITLIFYHISLVLSRTFFILELSNSMRF